MDGLGQSKAKKDKLYCSSRMKPKVLSPTTVEEKTPSRGVGYSSQLDKTTDSLTYGNT
ncbi:hypothetical protein SAY87_021849 [Trapa incisa]|uniref:Uncharacterized protein n=1 Tax=Trapa incisa TaxID=236973 RepID=A0AAN7JSA0_9MYRT|nr:hypothetical protein SAY87_021849 [Trapa incisa]